MKLSITAALLLSLLQVTNVVALALPESAAGNLVYRNCLRGLTSAENSAKCVRHLEVRAADEDTGGGGDGDTGGDNGGGDGDTGP